MSELDLLATGSFDEYSEFQIDPMVPIEQYFIGSERGQATQQPAVVVDDDVSPSTSQVRPNHLASIPQPPCFVRLDNVKALYMPAELCKDMI